MKKIIASILGLSLVFTAAIAVSAAPTVSGEVVYKANFENKGLADGLNDQNLFDGKVNFTGQLDNKTDYKLSLKGTNSAAVAIDEASFTRKFDAATIQAGFFGYNPSVMDIMDSHAEMKAPFAVKVMPNLGENIKVAVGVQPREDETLGDWAYQVEADYVMETVSLGVNYQNDRISDEAGLTFQVTAQPVEKVQVYGEFGQATGGADVSKIGGVYSTEKVSLRGEYDMENDANNWAVKAGYNFTSNIKGEFETNEVEEHQARLKYTF